MKPITRCSAVAIGLVTLTSACAQHDPGRNAIREMAKGNYQNAIRIVNAPGNPNNSPITDAERNYVLALIALKQSDNGLAQKHAREAARLGINAARFQVLPDVSLELLKGDQTFAKWIDSNRRHVLHGPMLGSMTDSSAKIWVRTDNESLVKLTARSNESESPNVKSTRTTAAADYTGVIELNGLRPDTQYQYRLLIDGNPVEQEYEFRTYPKVGSPGIFKIVLGGCAGYTQERERMWSTLGQHDIKAVLLLGDNVYIDDPTHLETHRYCYYRRQSEPRFQKLFSSKPVYAIYDDHDFGLNDCNPGPEIDTPTWKRKVWEVFRQNWPNPSFGGGRLQPGCWFDFQIGAVHFFMLDGRYYRDRDGGSMLGPVQKSWLKDALAASSSTFKVVATPVPITPGVKPGSKDTWDGFNGERQELWEFIDAKKIDGVVFMAADRHRSDFRRTIRDTGYPIYELMSAALTNVHTHNLVPHAKGSEFIMGYNKKCSFGLIEFNTTLDDPTIRYQIMNIDNELVDERIIRLSDISNRN